MSISFGENSKSPYAKVWKIDIFDRYVKAQISTSEKDKEGNYVNSSWFATFVGNCVTSAKELERGDSIKITAGKISMTKKEDKSYTNVVVFGFEKPDFDGDRKPEPKKQKPKQTQPLDDDDSEDFPF